MESDTSSPAGLEKGGPFNNPSTSDYFGTTFHSVAETGAGQQCATGNDAVSGADFSLEHHHPQQSAAAMALFPFPEPSGPHAVAASTAMMHAQPILDWQEGLSVYNAALFSPSIGQPDYYGVWASGAQPMAGLGLMSPHGVEEQSQQPQPQLQLQAQHQAWGQTMTPPDDNFPVAHETGRAQMTVPLHFVPGFVRLPASNGVSGGGSSMPVGGGGVSAEMAGFQYPSTGVGDQPQLSPVTTIDFIKSPSTLVLSPQPGTPGRRRRRPPISASSPASLSTVSASTKTARASSTSSHDDPVCPKPSRKSLYGSASRPRGRSSDVGRESNSKRPALTDDDDQDRGATATIVTGKSSFRARGSNREAAKKCREKTRLNEQHLEDRERAVKARNSRLRRELDLVKEEVQIWRSRLLMHGRCENSSINNWITNRAAEISEKILSPAPASQAPSQATAATPSRLQPLTPMPINGRLNFRLQPPPPPVTRRQAR